MVEESFVVQPSAQRFATPKRQRAIYRWRGAVREKSKNQRTTMPSSNSNETTVTHGQTVSVRATAGAPLATQMTN